MKRLLLSTTIATAALALAACGSDGAVGSSSTGAPAAQAATVSIMASGAMGNILVDSKGMALYSPDQEADGSVHCVGGCLKIWVPLAPGATTPTAASGGPTLGVIDRPDGTKQVTAWGRPLYTFFQDTQGHVTGDGAADTFDGQNFTWHVVHADGSVGAAPTGSTPPAATTPATGGYGY